MESNFDQGNGLVDIRVPGWDDGLYNRKIPSSLDHDLRMTIRVAFSILGNRICSKTDPMTQIEFSSVMLTP